MFKKLFIIFLVKKIDLYFLLGFEVMVRNFKGVIIKDVLDVIYK